VLGFIRLITRSNRTQTKRMLRAKTAAPVLVVACFPQDTIDSGVFARICKGLEESRLTPSRFLDFYLKATGTDAL
jgi:hypothetical protein